LTLLLFGDVLVACLALAAAVHLRRTVPIPYTRSLLPSSNLTVDLAILLLFSASFVAALALSGFYRFRVLSRARPILMLGLVIQVGLISIGATFLEQPLPRTVLVAVPLIEAVLLHLCRSMQQKLWPVRPRETILVGEPAEISAAFAVLDSTADQRIRVIAYAGSLRADVGAPWLGSLDNPVARTAVREVEEVICVSSDKPHGRLELLRIRGPRGYLLLASHSDALLISSVLGWLGDEPLVEVVINCGFGVRATIKRLIDVTGALLLAIVTLPLWIPIAIALLLGDCGPVLLRQMRLGLGGVPFGMWKFRSMRAGQTGMNVPSDVDRVTRVGRLLRRYRLDELPQLINVITGDMSLVGPRPERPEIAQRILEEVPDFDLRCLVRPGIAGLAQILAEYDSRPAVKLRYDLTYMCSWSLWLDVRLLFSSIAAALSGSGI